MKAQDVKTVLEKRWSSPVLEICLQIVEFIDSTPPQQLRYLTFRGLTRIAGKSEFDEEIFSAVTILSSSEVSVLDLHMQFFDKDDNAYDISLSELADARKAGNLVHPESGKLISDFEEFIVPYFSVSPSFSRSERA